MEQLGDGLTGTSKELLLPLSWWVKIPAIGSGLDMKFKGASKGATA